jgi:hypothetical protein
MTIERGGNFETPYVPFPPDAQRIKILDYSVYKYIDRENMTRLVKNLSDHVKLTDFDEVLVNRDGGHKLFYELSRLQNYQKYPYQCEYHRRGRETTPVDSLLRHRKVLVVDDSLESGITLAEIFRFVGPESRAVVVAILGDTQNPRVDAAVRIDMMNVAGYGGDHGERRHREFFRQLGEIVAIPPVPPIKLKV